MINERTYANLPVRTYASAAELGAAAADDFARRVSAKIAEHGRTSVILATGNSQDDFIASAREHPDIEWNRITIFHMDEYLGMSDSHPASFRRWMKSNLLNHVDVAGFEGVRGDADDVEAELQRYTHLLEESTPSICVLGVGENGHLAFNDPPADFETSELIHVVKLDEICRLQQVAEGHFRSLSDVPTQAISLTVHGLLRCDHVMAIVPELRKAKPVRASLEGPITPDMPASVLTLMDHAVMYLDTESASALS